MVISEKILFLCFFGYYITIRLCYMKSIVNI